MKCLRLTLILGLFLSGISYAQSPCGQLFNRVSIRVDFPLHPGYEITRNDLETGESITYRILDYLGEGGQAYVFRAVRLGSTEEVGIKVYKDSLPKADQRATIVLLRKKQRGVKTVRLGAETRAQFADENDLRNQRRSFVLSESGNHVIFDAEGENTPLGWSPEAHEIAQRLMRAGVPYLRKTEPATVFFIGGSRSGVPPIRASVLELLDRPFDPAEIMDRSTPAKFLESLKKIESFHQQLKVATTELRREGLVHRDLKPENLMIAKDGTLKIADLDLLAIEGSTPRLAGTLAYLSRDKVIAFFSGGIERMEVTHDDDRSAVGVILYQALFGDIPLVQYYDSKSKAAPEYFPIKLGLRPETYGWVYKEDARFKDFVVWARDRLISEIESYQQGKSTVKLEIAERLTDLQANIVKYIGFTAEDIGR